MSHSQYYSRELQHTDRSRFVVRGRDASTRTSITSSSAYGGGYGGPAAPTTRRSSSANPTTRKMSYRSRSQSSDRLNTRRNTLDYEPYSSARLLSESRSGGGVSRKLRYRQQMSETTLTSASNRMSRSMTSLTSPDQVVSARVYYQPMYPKRARTLSSQSPSRYDSHTATTTRTYGSYASSRHSLTGSAPGSRRSSIDSQHSYDELMSPSPVFTRAMSTTTEIVKEISRLQETKKQLETDILTLETAKNTGSGSTTVIKTLQEETETLTKRNTDLENDMKDFKMRFEEELSLRKKLEDVIGSLRKERERLMFQSVADSTAGGAGGRPLPEQLEKLRRHYEDLIRRNREELEKHYRAKITALQGQTMAPSEFVSQMETMQTEESMRSGSGGLEDAERRKFQEEIEELRTELRNFRNQVSQMQDGKAIPKVNGQADSDFPGVPSACFIQNGEHRHTSHLKVALGNGRNNIYVSGLSLNPAAIAMQPTGKPQGFVSLYPISWYFDKDLSTIHSAQNVVTETKTTTQKTVTQQKSTQQMMTQKGLAKDDPKYGSVHMSVKEEEIAKVLKGRWFRLAHHASNGLVIEAEDSPQSGKQAVAKQKKIPTSDTQLWSYDKGCFRNKKYQNCALQVSDYFAPSPVELAPCTGDRNQKWVIHANGVITSADTDFALDMDGHNVIINPQDADDSSTRQSWGIEVVQK
ncbi:uro-adherence factor A-like isoform X2 [Branchiostoma lanceolatum]|uniref:uro-adherence factor A-like isoform X2 n=1 Tax=Branchiostoma lanceolatum TaxID=7740 RepID=UPI0034520156